VTPHPAPCWAGAGAGRASPWWWGRCFRLEGQPGPGGGAGRDGGALGPAREGDPERGCWAGGKGFGRSGVGLGAAAAPAALLCPSGPELPAVCGRCPGMAGARGRSAQGGCTCVCLFSEGSLGVVILVGKVRGSAQDPPWAVQGAFPALPRQAEGERSQWLVRPGQTVWQSSVPEDAAAVLVLAVMSEWPLVSPRLCFPCLLSFLT